MNNFFKYRAYVFGVVIVLLAVFYSGFYAGKNEQSDKDKIVALSNKDSEVSAGVDFDAFWKAWQVINEKYVSTNSTTTREVTDQARVYGAIEGMVESLDDPYTIFFPPVESKSFSEEISGNFEGVGMEVGIKEGVLTVIAPLKDTPAYRAGIKSGDKIIKIDDTFTDGLSTTESIKLIKGKRGTKVKLTIGREGHDEPLIIDVVRDIINIPTIDTEVKSEVFIIRLYNFSATSPDVFREALRKFVESGKYKLIIDLRGNPGGYLEAAVDMASWFLPAGKIGALHEHGVATLVGSQSYGKGSVQELVEITPDTSLKVTIARWLTPNGLSISSGGLTPDVEVKFDEKEFAKGVDVQLNKAIEILNQ
ncbi:MAG: hypothetical protein UT25_C0001G0200 [Parcubacteria group bacterium GW2011_GWC1_39_12]|nr:MAG: hypothetical protein UT25_C0001G0200 [Parcubacteria group bacterium GW2011_GWC1_39_12]